MSIFTVFIDNMAGPEGSVVDAIKTGLHPYLEIKPTYFLISHPGSAKQISDDIGITDGRRGNGMVAEMASYYGRLDPGVWTWIKSHWATPPQ